MNLGVTTVVYADRMRDRYEDERDRALGRVAEVLRWEGVDAATLVSPTPLPRPAAPRPRGAWLRAVAQRISAVFV